MAKLYEPIPDSDVGRTPVAEIRKEYKKMAYDYNRIVSGKLYYCHSCDEFHDQNAFYSDKRFKSGLFPECKKSLMIQATDYDKKTNTYKDNKAKTKKVFEKLNIPYIESVYLSALSSVAAEVGEKNRSTAYLHCLTMVKSLPQYKLLTWADSEFDEVEIEEEQEKINENSRIIKNAKKRFGKSYSNEDLLFLENEYQDWIKRYTCENKSQEILFKNMCFTQLNIEKAQKEGKDTKDLLKTQQEIMGSLQIKPSQANSNALTEAKTFGQLIEKWEDEWDGGKPIPEPDKDFADVDKIGTYIDVFFKGHLAKMMGLKNGFSQLYDKFMAKYTVTKPQYEEDDLESEALFNQIFGKMDD